MDTSSLWSRWRAGLALACFVGLMTACAPIKEPVEPVAKDVSAKSPISAWILRGSDADRDQGQLIGVGEHGEIREVRPVKTAAGNRTSIGEGATVVYAAEADEFTIVTRGGAITVVPVADFGLEHVTAVEWWPARRSFLLAGVRPDDDGATKSALVEIDTHGIEFRRLDLDGRIHQLSLSGERVVAAGHGMSDDKEGMVALIDLATWSANRRWVWSDGAVVGCAFIADQVQCSAEALNTEPEPNRGWGFTLDQHTGQRSHRTRLASRPGLVTGWHQTTLLISPDVVAACTQAWACKPVDPSQDPGAQTFWWEGEDLVVTTESAPAREMPAGDEEEDKVEPGTKIALGLLQRFSVKDSRRLERILLKSGEGPTRYGVIPGPEFRRP